VAIDQVKELRPDVVILDLSMSVMNGLDAARAIKAIAPGTPILMFTLHAYPYLLDEARKVGIDQVLSKADSFATELLQAVRTWFTSWRLFLSSGTTQRLRSGEHSGCASHP
jgi:DNA-binding NarL/FixJ family response regulator